MRVVTSGGRRAVLLDRDGTLVYPRHYPSRPEELVLYPGIGAELRALKRAGFELVVVTNQSGIARGLFTEQTLTRMHAHLAAQLGGEGVRIAGWYHCPHHPDGRIQELAVRCECRKPAAGMLLRAAHDLGLNLGCCWMVGDILGDVEAGNRAGCRTILVDLGTEAPPDCAERAPSYIARDTVHALRLIRLVEGHAAADELVDLEYRPDSWPQARPGTPPGRRAASHGSHMVAHGADAVRAGRGGYDADSR